MRRGRVLLAAWLAGCAPGGADHEPASWGAVGREHMVAADHPLASAAGAEILARGGNAVDAAAATAFALAVVRPSSTGLGGGGFMLIHRPGEEPVALDYRETAPAAARPKEYLDESGRVIPGKTVRGRWAAAVPGLVRGLAAALKRYGTLPLAEVLEPAIRLAEEGFPVDDFNHRAMAELAEELAGRPRRAEFRELARIFLKDGRPYAAGELLRQPDLAATLKTLAREGPDAFYTGSIARKLLKDMRAGGGPWSLEDLAGYAVRERAPTRGRFRGYEVVGMPPPSTGGPCVVQILGVMEGFSPAADGEGAYYQALAEAMKHCFADRAALLGDPDAHPRVAADAAAMASPERARSVRAAIRPGRTFPPERYGSKALKDDAGTTHYSVMDSKGMAVSATDTINLSFGSWVVPAGTGIVLNDEMDDFAVRADVPNEFGLLMSERNLVGPGRRPLSSMSPTLLVEDGRAVLAAGASGGPRILTATLQAILRIVDFGELPDDAVAAKRIHHQWMPDVLRAEDGLPEKVRSALAAAGHRLEAYPGQPGVCQVVLARNGLLYGASDPRKGGRPAGK